MNQTKESEPPFSNLETKTFWVRPFGKIWSLRASVAKKKNSHKNTKARKPTKAFFVESFGAISCCRGERAIICLFFIR
jgi:hypothetical protein